MPRHRVLSSGPEPLTPFFAPDNLQARYWIPLFEHSRFFCLDTADELAILRLIHARLPVPDPLILLDASGLEVSSPKGLGPEGAEQRWLVLQGGKLMLFLASLERLAPPEERRPWLARGFNADRGEFCSEEEEGCVLPVRALLQEEATSQEEGWPLAQRREAVRARSAFRQGVALQVLRVDFPGLSGPLLRRQFLRTCDLLCSPQEPGVFAEVLKELTRPPEAP